MHLTRLSVSNFGPIKRIDLKLDPKFNVIVGVNGAGKTTILRALSTALSRYSSSVRTGRAGGIFDHELIRRGASALEVEVTAEHEAASYSWKMGRFRPGRIRSGLNDSKELIELAKVISGEIERSKGKAPLPLVVAYPVNRAVLDIPLRIRKTPFEQYSALDGALLQNARNFRSFFAWFREREDVENETRADDASYRDPQLSAVRTAVEGLMPSFKKPRVRRQPLRMLVTKNKVDFRVDELSDGEKGVLALAGDLAKRLAIANPGARYPLKGQAVVLIDEIELHLHPGWQRQLVRALQDTFPNCQFIVTTHSPQVVSEVGPESVFLLTNGEIKRPVRTFGQDSSLILEELMSTPGRPKWAKAAIKSVYELLDDDEPEEALKALRKAIEKLGVDDPSLAPAKRILLSKRQTAA